MTLRRLRKASEKQQKRIDSMVPSSLSPIANHLWQSTLFVAAVWLTTLALRENRAAVRHWLWLAASVKFLIPFSLLINVGSQLAWQSAPRLAQPEFAGVITQVSRPFGISTGISPLASAPRTIEISAILTVVWL